MLMTRLHDGTLLLEVRGDQFAEAYKAASLRERVVLDDKRPAVRRESAEGVTITTLNAMAWDVLKFLKRTNRTQTVPRLRRCDNCHTELKIDREREQYWVFSCPSCHSVQIDGKSIIGGQVGAGEKEPT